jgi:hypothetical protein
MPKQMKMQVRKRQRKHKKIVGGSLMDEVEQIQNMNMNDIPTFIKTVEDPTELLQHYGVRTTEDIIAGTGKKLSPETIKASDRTLLTNYLLNSKQVEKSPATEEYNKGFNSMIEMWERDEDPYMVWSDKWNSLNAIDPKTGDFNPYLKGQVDGLAKLRSEIPIPPKREHHWYDDLWTGFKHGLSLGSDLLPALGL